MLVKNEKVFFPIDIVKSHAGDIYTSNAHMKKNTTNSTILIGKIIGRVFQRLSYPIGFIFGEIINVFSGNPHLWDKAKDSGCLFVSGFGKDPEETSYLNTNCSGAFLRTVIRKAFQDVFFSY